MEYTVSLNAQLTPEIYNIWINVVKYVFIAMGTHVNLTASYDQANHSNLIHYHVVTQNT